MARVYAAEHAILRKRVAIKTLLPQVGRCAAARELLMREARIAAEINHPNVVDVYDFAIDDAGPYYVMELATGHTLADRLQQGPLSLPQCLDICIRLADAVAAIHAAGYIHRDIKSENVVLTTIGRRLEPKLIDFGIAKALDPNPNTNQLEGMIGTPQTMAPEQISQDTIDERTDVWALGVLFYEMLTGHLPFPTGCTTRDDLIAIVTEPPLPLPLGLQSQVHEIIDACLSKDPEERLPSAAALVDRLRAARRRNLASRRAIERIVGY